MPGAASSAAPPRAPGRVPLREVVFAALAYLAYAVFLTWPLAANLGDEIYAAGLGGDLTGAIAHTREVVDERLFPWAPGDLPQFNAPYGAPEQWVLNWATLPGTALLYGLSFAFGAVPGHSLFTLLMGFVASGTAMFALTRWLFGSTGAALLAGFAFAFYPFAVGKAEGHLHFMHGWVLVLPLWRMIVLARLPSARNGLLAGAAVAFAMWFTPYFVLIGAVEAAVLGAVVLAACAARGELWRGARALALAVVPVVVLMGSLGALSILASGEGTTGVRSQSLDELVTYSARVHEFVVPDRRNLLVGDRTEPFLSDRIHGSNFSENSLYLGLSVLALALLGALGAARLLVRDRRRLGGDRALTGAVAAGLVAVVGIAFSAPPKVALLGMQIPFPSWFVFQVTSTWRVYSRFVVIVMLGLAVLLAFALARHLAARPARLRLPLFAALALVLAIDLWARPEVRTVSTEAPAAHQYVAGLGAGIVAEYPILPATTPEYRALFFQRAYDKPLLQGYSEGTEEESRKLELVDLADRDTPGDLALLGVRWLIVNTATYDMKRLPPRGRGLRELVAYPDYRVFEVAARPSPARVDALAGFALVEGPPDGHYRWLGEPRGVLGVSARGCDPCSGVLRFQVNANGPARMLKIAEEGSGRVLQRVAVPAPPGSAKVAVPLSLSDGEARLVLTTDPGPTPAPAPDPRILSVAITEPRFQRDR